MSRMFRAWLIGLSSIAAFVVFTSSARALIASPTSLSAVAGGTTLRINPTGGGSVDATCTGSTISGTITNTGTGVATAPVSIPAGSAIFRPCILAGGNLTVTQVSAWSGVVTVLLDLSNNVTGVELAITVPSRGVTFASAAGCNFTVSGRRTILTTAITSLGAGTGTALIRNISATVPDLTLIVDSTNGSLACSAARIAVNNTSTFLGTYSLNSGAGTLIRLS